MSMRALQLRCQLANALARAEHFAAQLAPADEAAPTGKARDALLAKFTAAVRDAHARRTALADISAPTTGASNTPAASQLGQVGTVTSDAAQPATSL